MGVDVDTVRDIIGIIGNVISFGLFLSPIPTFVKICRRGAVEDFSAAPYVATLLNCMLWVFYGMPFVHPHSILIVTINGVGVVLESLYLAIFVTFAPNQQRARVLAFIAVELAFVGAVAAIVLLTCHTFARRSLVVGSLCVVFCIIMYASPLSVMKLVIQTKCVKYMPFLLSLAGFLNGACWLTYALLRFDVFVTIPNAMGALLGLVQLIIYAIYYREPESMQAAEPGGGGGGVEMPPEVQGQPEEV